MKIKEGKYNSIIFEIDDNDEKAVYNKINEKCDKYNTIWIHIPVNLKYNIIDELFKKEYKFHHY